MKKETISSLSKELQEIKNIYRDRDFGYRTFPEWVKATKQLQEARKNLKAVEDKLGPKVSQMRDDLNKRQKEIQIRIQELQKSNRKFQVPEDIQKWLDKDYQRGINFVSKLSLVWISDDRKYGIVRWPGAVHWHGRGTFGYDPSEYYGVEIFGSAGNRITNINKYQGRLTKEMKEEIIKDIYETVSRSKE